MAFKTCQRNFHVQKACKNVPTFSFSATLLKKCSIKLNMKSCDMSWQSVAVTFHSTPVFIIHSLVFSPQAGFSRNQNPVRRPVWLLHTASWANSQGQVAIEFPQDVTIQVNLLFLVSCTCFGRCFCPSSGALDCKAVSIHP